MTKNVESIQDLTPQKTRTPETVMGTNDRALSDLEASRNYGVHWQNETGGWGAGSQTPPKQQMTHEPIGEIKNETSTRGLSGSDTGGIRVSKVDWDKATGGRGTPGSWGNSFPDEKPLPREAKKPFKKEPVPINNEPKNPEEKNTKGFKKEESIPAEKPKIKPDKIVGGGRPAKDPEIATVEPKPATEKTSGFPDGIDRRSSHPAFQTAMDTLDPSLKAKQDDGTIDLRNKLFYSFRDWKNGSGEKPYSVPEGFENYTPAQREKFETYINAFRPTRGANEEGKGKEKPVESESVEQVKPEEPPATEEGENKGLFAEPEKPAPKDPHIINYGETSMHRTMPHVEKDPHEGQMLYWKDNQSGGIAPSGRITSVDGSTVNYDYFSPDGTKHSLSKSRSDFDKESGYFFGDSTGMTLEEKKNYGIGDASSIQERNPSKIPILNQQKDGHYGVTVPDGKGGFLEQSFEPGATMGNITIEKVIPDPSGHKLGDMIYYRDRDGVQHSDTLQKMLEMKLEG